MSDAWHSLKITEFEQVPAGSMWLLRLTGKGSRRREAAPDERPVLVADDGREVAIFAPLPSPPDEPGVLRVAYSVPAGVLTPETSFSLRLGDGHLIALPAPVPRGGTAPPPAAPVPGPDYRRDEELRRELADAHRRAEDALLQAAAARDRRDVLEQRTAELEEALRERQAAFDELEIWRGELERRLASMSTELGDTAARLRTAEAEVEALRRQFDPAAEELEPPEPVEPVEPPPAIVAEAPLDLDDLRRRAAAEAGEVAARELAEAAADAPASGL